MLSPSISMWLVQRLGLCLRVLCQGHHPLLQPLRWYHRWGEAARGDVPGCFGIDVCPGLPPLLPVFLYCHWRLYKLSEGDFLNVRGLFSESVMTWFSGRGLCKNSWPICRFQLFQSARDSWVRHKFDDTYSCCPAKMQNVDLHSFFMPFSILYDERGFCSHLILSSPMAKPLNTKRRANNKRVYFL